MDEVISGINTESWLDTLLSKAIDLKASDIHIEPQREVINIRIRVDGLLYIIENLHNSTHDTVVSHIKIVSQMDSTESRLPQDGHFEYPHADHIFNIRVSTFPTIYGEAVVMRILNRESTLLDLGSLGFDQQQLGVVYSLIRQPYGMILITGPSGSGKTTLLYSILNVLNQSTHNIITVEDPIELQIDGMRQTQVNEFSKLDFKTALRSVLRQDPDIVMVGEIRDDESAQIAMQAALSGRLVFSTFHTLNVPGVVARLIEMKIPQSVIANAITGVVSVRLVRKICPICKEAYQPSDEERILLEGNLLPQQTFYRGRGCGNCLNSGFFGRIGIFEVVPFDEDVRFIILEKRNLSEMSAMFRQKKIKNLQVSAMDKVYQGATTIAEVLRVTGG